MNPQYESCQECGAPLDRQQRYCVNCAARRSDASNPASRYFAAASRQRRLARAPADPERSSRSGTGRAAAVFFFALLPIAVAIGVVVGRTGSGDEDKLLAALREGNVTAAAASTDAGAGQTATVSSKLLVSDFSLDKGFVVELDKLPIDGTDQAAADQAKSDAEDKGADGRRDHQPRRLHHQARPGAGELPPLLGRVLRPRRGGEGPRRAAQGLPRRARDRGDGCVGQCGRRERLQRKRRRQRAEQGRRPDEPRNGASGDRHEADRRAGSGGHADRAADRQPDRTGLHRLAAEPPRRDRRRRGSRRRPAAADGSGRLMPVGLRDIFSREALKPRPRRPPQAPAPGGAQVPSRPPRSRRVRRRPPTRRWTSCGRSATGCSRSSR